MIDIGPDDGSAEWAAEAAVVYAAMAWWRRTHNEGKNGGEIIMAITKNARENITPEQWKSLGREPNAPERVVALYSDETREAIEKNNEARQALNELIRKG